MINRLKPIRIDQYVDPSGPNNTLTRIPANVWYNAKWMGILKCATDVLLFKDDSEPKIVGFWDPHERKVFIPLTTIAIDTTGMEFMVINDP